MTSASFGGMHALKEEEGYAQAAAAASTDKDDLDSDGNDSDSADAADFDSAGGAGTTDGEPTDKLARLRREKRLAMNRESARARRKRKKVLLQTMEQQVAEMTKRNQQFQLTNESLTARVNELETELGIARSTINILSKQIPGQGVALNNMAGITSQESLRRLLQAQQGSAFAQQGLAASNAPGLRLEDALLRRHALDMQALSQAGRDSALESMFGRVGGLVGYAQGAHAAFRPVLQTSVSES